ncbi:ABC transporter permease [Listeria sp. SHR_NRA_18]|nr:MULTISPECIES: ABC transporter permease [Listeria]KGL42180.1 teichoic acid transport system permease [Listeriaceae bacterium FSL A5-0209]KGL38227.1 teichoic acid transport system permease [Listeria newyorkensis]KMT63391.1 teichoic acid transport system permease protein [Listeria newyorkensis]RQW67699.1 ABC transporter permease [Listeria sp. SHR_NRA_18]WAO22756.1 ABC transporter permease [Listeria newyorkensis]
MNVLINWCRVQLYSGSKIMRVARFDKKAAHQNHFLGLFWEFLSPTIQIVIYYLIFGLRLGGQNMVNSDVPYVYWMLMGVIPWFYMSASINAGANSISANLNLISKTKFPVEILPTIAIVKGLSGFFSMFGLFLCLYIGTGNFPNIHWLQFIYYFFAMILLLVSVSTLNAVVVIFFRDYQLIISSTMRLLFFISGVVIDVSANPDSLLTKILHLNPFVYVIEGFRDALLARAAIFDHFWWGIYFFSSTFLILVIGIYATTKYKRYFVEYT